MKSITITGLSIQADCFGEGDKDEAGQVIDAINTAIGGLNGNPCILGAGDIDNSQVEIEVDEDERQQNEISDKPFGTMKFQNILKSRK